jgi:hypothetical protein
MATSPLGARTGTMVVWDVFSPGELMTNEQLVAFGN